MKHYIKSFLLFALVCVGLVSCNEQDTADSVVINKFPKDPSFQIWKTPKVQLGEDCHIVHSIHLDYDTVRIKISADKSRLDTICTVDTICHILLKLPEGEYGALAAGGRTEYIAGAGMYRSKFSSSLYEGLPFESVVCRTDYDNNAFVKFYQISSEPPIPLEAFNAVGQNGFPLENLYWHTPNPFDFLQVEFYFMPENKVMFAVTEGEEYKMYAGTYEWSTILGQGKLHISVADDDGMPIEGADVTDLSIYLNKINQLVINANGSEYVVQIELM